MCGCCLSLSTEDPEPRKCAADVVERSPSPEPYFDLAAAVARVSDPYRITFLDLPPEIRTTIYRHTFKGHVIMIRGKDFVTRGRDKEKLYRYYREKDVGLNLMFVNKTVLAEVKAVALSVATYDINFTSMLNQGNPTYLRRQQGFGRVELSFLRTIVIQNWPRAVAGLAHQLLAMPFLHDVTWEPEKMLEHRDVNRFRPWDTPEDGTSFDWDALITNLLDSYGEEWSAKQAIKEHVKQAGARVKKPARFALKFHMNFLPGCSVSQLLSLP